MMPSTESIHNFVQKLNVILNRRCDFSFMLTHFFINLVCICVQLVLKFLYFADELVYLVNRT